MIGVLDYGAGNLGSVMNALHCLGVSARFASGPEEISVSSSPFEKIIFPGDGHWTSAMASLNQSGYTQAIKEWVQADKPFLGICIGLQLLFETSEEALAANAPVSGSAQGLSVLSGNVRRFPGRKVPQIGWNQTAAREGSKLFKGLRENSFFYYIHSYYAVPADASVIAAETEYYTRYCCAVQRGALAAVQFHPEKSGETGLQLLRNWIAA